MAEQLLHGHITHALKQKNNTYRVLHFIKHAYAGVQKQTNPIKFQTRYMVVSTSQAQATKMNHKRSDKLSAKFKQPKWQYWL